MADCDYPAASAGGMASSPAAAAGGRRLRLRRPLRSLFWSCLLVLVVLLPRCVQSYDGASEDRRRAAPGKVAYGIMVYQRQGKPVEDVFRQFKRLFDALYSERFTYVVHVDIKSEKRLLDTISDYLGGFPNAHEIPSVSVSWAGVTVVERTLALMQEALEVDPDWEYFVNIGQDDYPLTSAAEIEASLAVAPQGTNFIHCWDLAGHDFFGQWERHDRRVSKVFLDFFDGKALELVKTFRKPPEEFHFYKSLQQTVLARPFVEYACYSSASRRLLLFLANSQAPDEIFFPTLLFTDERYSSSATCNDTRHLSHWIRPGGSWHPEYLTPLHLPLILEKRADEMTGPLYARKVDEAKGSRRLLEVLDRLRDCPDALTRVGMDWIVPLLFDSEEEELSEKRRRHGKQVVEAKKPHRSELFDKCDLEGLAAEPMYQDGELLRGMDVLKSLDKARRVQDAELIMAFIADYEKKTGHLIRPWKPQPDERTPPPLAPSEAPVVRPPPPPPAEGVVVQQQQQQQQQQGALRAG